jgi:hypothetical protein
MCQAGHEKNDEFSIGRYWDEFVFRKRKKYQGDFFVKQIRNEIIMINNNNY